jgi:hypothetical protein
MAPRKRPTPSRSAAAIAADSVFWQTLHSGAYHQLPHAIEVLTRAYVATPGCRVAAHLANGGGEPLGFRAGLNY